MNEEVLQVYSVCMRIYAPKQFQEVDLKNPKATRLSSLKTQKEKSKAKSQEEPLGTPWDFYLYVALTLLNWSEDFF